MTVLVTGGGGFLGRYVVQALLDRGEAVRVLARGAYPDLAERGVECVRGDIADAEAVNRAVEGCDVVHHVAGQPGIWGPREMYWRPNVEGTRNVVEACKAHGVGRLIYTSSPSAVFGREPHVGADESLPYPDTYLCHYPASKAAGERLALGAHEPGVLHTTALRPHLIWGPGDHNLIPRVIERARAGRLARVGDGTNEVSVVYVENAAQAQVAAQDALQADAPAAGGKPYFIAQPEPVRLWDFIGAILEGVGAPAVTRSISHRAARRIGAAFEAVYTILPLTSEPRMTRFVADQLGTSHWYRVDAACRDLGYDPSISTEEGLRRLFAAYEAGQGP